MRKLRASALAVTAALALAISAAPYISPPQASAVLMDRSTVPARGLAHAASIAVGFKINRLGPAVRIWFAWSWQYRPHRWRGIMNNCPYSDGDTHVNSWRLFHEKRAKRDRMSIAACGGDPVLKPWPNYRFYLRWRMRKAMRWYTRFVHRQEVKYKKYLNKIREPGTPAYKARSVPTRRLMSLNARVDMTKNVAYGALLYRCPRYGSTAYQNAPRLIFLAHGGDVHIETCGGDKWPSDRAL
jgi:hypothetical protein